MGQVRVDNVSSPRVPQYFSRPDLQPPRLQVKFQGLSRDSRGHIFLAPSSTSQLGPYIYDLDGNLVWSGFGMLSPSKVHGPHVCPFQGTPHLCFFSGNQIGQFARGQGVIANSEYQVVATISGVGTGIASDLHEFRLTSGGETALITIYSPRQFEISNDGVLEFVWIMDSIFQEINVSSGKLLFEWHSLDHVHPLMSYVPLGHSDEGVSSSKPWDYFHINSVDKNLAGDYLISARHTHCIYKVSGQNGSIIWQLQGKNSSFNASGFSFAWQHDARWVQENSTNTVISLFDNGRTQHVADSASSSGKIVSINHETATTSLLAKFDATFAPTRLISSISQGSLQNLDNGNVFIGWGAEPYISEHLPNGTTLWFATWDDESPNYRASKADWNGFPIHTMPAVWSYAKTKSSRTAIYASWNGATNVHSWAAYTSDLLEMPINLTRMANVVPKTGFETLIWLEHYYPRVMVEALDKDGKGLANSSIFHSVVPSSQIQTDCGDSHCLDIPNIQDKSQHLLLERWTYDWLGFLLISSLVIFTVVGLLVHQRCITLNLYLNTKYSSWKAKVVDEI